MDNSAVVESMDRSEARSESLGEKRPLENGVDRDLAKKKARRGGGDVGLTGNVKKVAEIVLVLSTMGKMRAGRKPTPVEIQMMAEAREKLADICKEFAPKDIFPSDAFGTVIEDFGLNRSREQRLGVRPPKMSIAVKLQLTKQKMEKSEVFPLHSTMYTPPRLQSNLSGAAESRGTPRAARMFQSDKANHASISSGSLQHPANVVHASSTNSRTLPYELPTSEVRPGVSNALPSSHLGRDSSSLPVPRAERPHFRINGVSNGSSYTSQSQVSAGDHATGKTPTWSMQPQSASFAKVGSDVATHTSVKAEGISDLSTSRVASQGIMSKPFITQVTPSPMNVNHVQHCMSFTQAPSAADTHNEISKIVQKLLQPHLPDHPVWTPPSRDYMNKALSCQMCKGIINDVDNALICDACERGYHLRCLQCSPKAIPRGDWQEWHCVKCLALSNGKPLPPKFGRVMRNISTPKLSSIAAAVQPVLDNKVQSSDENVDQQMMAANGNSVSQSASETTGGDSKLTEIQVNETHEHQPDEPLGETCASNSVERSHEANLVIGSESLPPANLEAVASLSGHLLKNHQNDNLTKMPSITNTLANQPQNNLLSNVPEISHSGKKLECGSTGANKPDEQGDPVRTIETCTVVSGHEGSSSSNMHEVEWVGSVLKQIDGKTYYQSCCINGTVYKVKDYALFSSPGNKYLPNRLQAMWEDNKTSKKWVTVTRCFFPGDLPEGVGRPCAPESNEVYESNHESTLAAGLIHGPCEVLPPCKFAEETGVRTRFGARGRNRSKSLFLCKWFYDETKRLFRDVSC